MNIKAIIFDLDGVIVSTDLYHYQAWKKMADKIGVYFDEKINERLRGVSRMASLEIILEKYQGPAPTLVEKESWAEEKNAIYRKLLNNMTANDVSEDVRSTLSKLSRRGYKLAIGSSSKNAKLILEKIGLTSAFDFISDGTNITNSKPNPEVFIKAAEGLAVKPSECLVVEDAVSGIDAAKAGGMYAAGIASAAKYENVDLALDNLKDLLNLCRGFVSK